MRTTAKYQVKNNQWHKSNTRNEGLGAGLQERIGGLEQIANRT